MKGTKFAPRYILHFEPGEIKHIECRLYAENEPISDPFDHEFQEIFQERKQEAQIFYDKKISPMAPKEEKSIVEQAYGGLFWSKQFYNYVVTDWLKGGMLLQPPPPEERIHGRNVDGCIFMRAMCYRCQTSGNTHGLPLGIMHFRWWHLPRLIQTLKRTDASIFARMVHAPKWCHGGLRVFIFRC